MLRFEDWFWGTSGDPLAGIHLLHQRQEMGTAELEEVVHLLQLRVGAEEQYAAKLGDIGRLKLRADGFGKDDSLLCALYTSTQRELMTLSIAHKKMSDEISAIIKQIQTYLEENRKLSLTGKEKIDATWKQLEKQRCELVAIEKDYQIKCQVADVEQRNHELAHGENDLPAMDIMITVGRHNYTVEEFNSVLARMQCEIPTQEVKLLWGSAKDCFTSEDAVQYLKTILHIEEEESHAFFEHLQADGFVKNVGRTAAFGQSQHFQWRKHSNENEPNHRRRRREADRADFEYKKAVMSTEDIRLRLEGECLHYMNSLQHAEMRRLELFKQAYESLNVVERIAFVAIDDMCERNATFVETLNPEKEVEILVERSRTGTMRIPPALYTDFYEQYPHGCYGVSLEDLATREGTQVPAIVEQCLAVLDKRSPSATESHLEMWLGTTRDIASLHSLRSTLNVNKSTSCNLQDVEPSLIAQALKMFLIELPISVCSDEIYEPLKILYLSKADDSAPHRIASLRSMLHVLPTAHFQSLKLLGRHWHRSVKGLDPESKKIADLAQHLGHYVLRPCVQTSVTLHDKHPARLIKDMLLFHDDIFNHADNRSSDTASLRSVDLDDCEADAVDGNSVSLTAVHSVTTNWT
ncbi:hypothetical protein BC832DRAFT_567209 [Gaertneriomyces semiglobifer]|nr:hypothetical protein BC832DRAFT_567209 [Gaertneriomyces semiglobifer]